MDAGLIILQKGGERDDEVELSISCEILKGHGGDSVDFSVSGYDNVDHNTIYNSKLGWSGGVGWSWPNVLRNCEAFGGGEDLNE